MEPIRWGIVGAGGIANTVARDFEYVTGAELVAVAARELSRAEEFARNHNLPRAYGDYLGLLDDPDIDVVYIATTHPQHRDLALAAIDRGKAILVEKAFTASLFGTEQVVAAAQVMGTFCMEGMWTRFLPVVAAAREVIAWGRIGEVVAVQGDLFAFREYDPKNRLFNPETGGGAILDLGVYVISFAQAFLGTAKKVHCLGRFAPNGVELAASISIEYTGGGIASLSCGFDGQGPGRMAIIGTKGWIEIEPRFHHPTTISIHRTGVLPRIIEAKPIGRGYAHEIMEVSQRVRAGETESPIMPLADTLEVMKVMQTCMDQLGISHAEARVL